MKKSNNYKQPIYRELRYGKMSYKVNYTILGVKHTKRFKSQAEAEEFYDQVVPIYNKMESDIIDADLLKATVEMLMEQKGVTKLKDVYSCLFAHLEPDPAVNKPLLEAVHEFLELKAHKLRTSGLIQYKRVLKNLVQATGQKHPRFSHCTLEIIRNKVLKGHTDAGSTYMMKLLSAFFNWAIQQKYIKSSPIVNVPKTKHKKKGGFNATVMHPIAANIMMALLANSAKRQEETIIALLAFVGLRPYEVCIDKNNSKVPLKWNDILPSSQSIRMREDNSKTHQECMIVNTPQRVWNIISKWPIQTFTSDTCLGISKYKLKKLYTQINDKLKVAEAKYIRDGGTLLGNQSFTLTRDILRHSFATYAVLYLGLEATVMITRHSFDIMRKHYIGIATKQQAMDYFNGMDISEYMLEIMKVTGSDQI